MSSHMCSMIFWNQISSLISANIIVNDSPIQICTHYQTSEFSNNVVFSWPSIGEENSNSQWEAANLSKISICQKMDKFLKLIPHPGKFENLMSYLQLSADQLMLWSVPNFFGHLSGQFEILQAKISWKIAFSSAK